MKIDITRLDKKYVLWHLYNEAEPIGPTRMIIDTFGKLASRDDVCDYVDRGGDLLIDYFEGISMKVDLRNDSFEATMYDSDNGGEGMALFATSVMRTTSYHPWCERCAALTELLRRAESNDIKICENVRNKWIKKIEWFRKEYGYKPIPADRPVGEPPIRKKLQITTADQDINANHRLKNNNSLTSEQIQRLRKTSI